ncbi:LPS export ABC transporter periplasmic protein LptC [Acinetobacter sp. HY1485]|uniref:LPS export ABC transporter periplasmic protein LptC n=1 Tax=Acinetobacter sp. HY1485 TaxID=2970918 RepID=UPI0022B989EE|nr:LPS export ABC transporter periplasmic protein LptC [Acinetobacter sp. HY1485]
METKNLYVIALIIATVSGGYYYFSGSSKKLNNDAARNTTYAAQDVHLTQTDATGLVSVRASIKDASQDQTNGTSLLNQLNATTYIQGQPDTTYFATRATGYDDNQKIILSGDVTANKNTPQGVMVFKTDQLTGYPKTKQVETDHLVHVDSAQSTFVSHGLKADLNSGQYEFFNIRGNYAPKS